MKKPFLIENKHKILIAVFLSFSVHKKTNVTYEKKKKKVVIFLKTKKELLFSLD